MNTEPRDMYLGRVAAIEGGCSVETPGRTLNRPCGSGLQAVISATQRILLGETDVAVAGGAQNMSRGPCASLAARWGARMGNPTLTDMMLGALHDPFDNIHMGVTAENVAANFDISRAQQDEAALESRRRVQHAIAEGRFKAQIVAVPLAGRRGTVMFDTDEHVRLDARLEDMSKLKPAFKKDGDSVTAGNASGLNDAAAALVLMERAEAERRGLKPLARLVSYAHASVDPKIMGIGPVPASRKSLEKAGLKASGLDVVEANEAFAAQACAVSKELGLDAAKVNPNGSGISLGHPVGATGALITVKALYELQRTQARYALVTMCIGGGQGIAAVFERC